MDNFFEDEEENRYKPMRASNFWRNNFIGCESNGDKNKRLSVEESVNKVRPYLIDIVNNLKKPGTWESQITIEINFISSVDNSEEIFNSFKK